MKFSMPYGEILEIRPSKEMFDTDIKANEKVDGLLYNLYWEEKVFPFCVTTKCQAIGMALAIQWAAKQLQERNFQSGLSHSLS